VPLWRAARVCPRPAGVNRRGPHLVPAQAAVARRPHPLGARTGRVPAQVGRHHPAAQAATRGASGQQSAREAPLAGARRRPQRHGEPWMPRCHATRRAACPAGCRGLTCYAACSPRTFSFAGAAAAAASWPS
jgi:hypothetical protein